MSRAVVLLVVCWLFRLLGKRKGGSGEMDQREIVLAGLAPAQGAQHSPVQVQKLFFLIDENIPDLVDGPHFEFAPYNYGPFDKTVYEVLVKLAGEGVVDLTAEQRWVNYRLTVAGQKLADQLFDELPEEAKAFIAEASDFVRKLSFTQLVSSIYKAYPRMRANSVFQG